MKPYFFILFLIYAGGISFGKMGFQNALTRILKSLYGTGHYLDWVQLWFLPHLFVVSLYAFLFYAVMGRVNNRWVRWLVLLLTLGVSSLFLHTFYPFSVNLLGKDLELFGLPFSLDLVLLSGFFFILGNETRQVTSEQLFGNVFFLMVTGAVLLLLDLFFAARIDFNTRVYESYVINTIEAVSGILFVLALSRQIELRVAWLGSVFKYFGKISLIILLFHVPIQDFWGQKIFAVTNNQPLSIWLAFVMGVLGSALIYELFIKTNPVASFWLGREAELPKKEEPIRADVTQPEEEKQPVVNP
jgi:fucose 4-O-acetylase-like acetyltransferase